MFDMFRDSFEMLRDQVWFFRFFLIIGVICVYRTLLHYVLSSNHCANPFCSKCLDTGTVRSRAIRHLKNNSEEDEKDESLNCIVLNNLLQHDRFCQRNDEKPTVYFHRGLSSAEITLPDQQILLDHYDELRQEMVKFFQTNEQITWTNHFLFKNGVEQEVNCQTFPKLFEVLHLLPNAMCIHHPQNIFGNCLITRLTTDENNTEENPSGLTNCCLRLHLGLICDDASSAFVLLGKRKRLPITNGKTILYNDALEHSIRNPQEKQQVFLTIDFWHPDLSGDMRRQLTSIFHTNLA